MSSKHIDPTSTASIEINIDMERNEEGKDVQRRFFITTKNKIFLFLTLNPLILIMGFFISLKSLNFLTKLIDF